MNYNPNQPPNYNPNPNQPPQFNPNPNPNPNPNYNPNPNPNPNYPPQPNINYNYQNPVNNPTPQKAPADPQVVSLASGSFSKGLASVIMAEFPVLSIIAIILGFIGAGQGKRAALLAEQLYCERPGKALAGKILGYIGGGLAIFWTIFWAIYIFVIYAAVTAVSSF